MSHLNKYGMSLINKYGMFAKYTCLVPFLCFALFNLQACGLPSEAGGTSGASNNDSGSGPGTDPVGEVRRFKGLIINVERINGETEVGTPSLISLSASGAESRFGLPQHDLGFSPEADNVLLQIYETDYVEHLSHVVRVAYGSGETYYAPLPPNILLVDEPERVTTSVTANIFTHFVITRLLSRLVNEDQLNNQEPCLTGGPLVNCLNQPRAKQGTAIKHCENGCRIQNRLC